MLRTVAVFGILGSLTLAAASVAGGCSSKSSAGASSGEQVDCTSATCPVCTGPGADASMPVSFATDIQPILQRSCGVGGATCHGSYPGSSNAGQHLYLAEPTANADGDGDAGAILSEIVGKASLEAPSMDIVAAGDPSNSYLMHKVNGDMCAIMSDCAPISTSFPTALTVPCGVQMPQNSPALLASEATLIWDWIAQGAQNN